MNQTLQDLLLGLAIAVIPVLTTFTVAFIRKKTEEIMQKITDKKMIEAVNTAVEVVVDAVSATTQTYVESLKKQGAFTKEAQIIAFNQSRSAAIAQISESTKKLIIDKYGDFDLWLKNKIESLVGSGKNATVTLAAVAS